MAICHEIVELTLAIFFFVEDWEKEFDKVVAQFFCLILSI
jgi:hypothetical protein